MPATSIQHLTDAAASRMGRRGISRRSFLVRTAVVGSALAVAPKRFLFEPGTAYANITGVCGTGEEPDCPGGFSVFCATVNNGLNKCPGNSVPGGWWRADGSSWCCGGSRYYIDCHYPCNAGCTCPPAGSGQFMAGVCDDSSGCQPGCWPPSPRGCVDIAGNCDKRRRCLTPFRYGQCNVNQHACLSNVVCRVVSCVSPDLIPSLNCGSTVRTDDTTREHSAPGLVMPSWENAELVLPDVFFTGSPAVAQSRSNPGRTDVVVAGSGVLRWNSQSTAYGPWGNWSDIGQPSAGFKGSPTAVALPSGDLVVFVWGGDDRLWWKRRIGGTWDLQWVQPLGTDGTLASNPTAVAYGSNQINVYVVGTDNQVYERFWVNYAPNPAWVSRGKPPSPIGIVGHVGAASWGDGRMDLFARGTDNRLWQAFWIAGNAWTGWFKPVGDNGTMNSIPEAASWEPGHLAVFVRGTDGGVWWLNYDQRRSFSWTGWQRIGGGGDVIQFDPRAGSRGCHRLDVFGRGTNDKLYRYRFIS